MVNDLRSPEVPVADHHRLSSINIRPILSVLSFSERVESTTGFTRLTRGNYKNNT